MSKNCKRWIIGCFFVSFWIHWSSFSFFSSGDGGDRKPQGMASVHSAQSVGGPDGRHAWWPPGKVSRLWMCSQAKWSVASDLFHKNCYKSFDECIEWSVVSSLLHKSCYKSFDECIEWSVVSSLLHKSCYKSSDECVRLHELFYQVASGFLKLYTFHSLWHTLEVGRPFLHLFASSYTYGRFWRLK